LHAVRTQLAGLLGQRPAVLALQWREQPVQILPCPPTRLGPAEMPADPSIQSVQTGRPAVHLMNRDVPTHAQFNE
jgi:hypothetical protein